MTSFWCLLKMENDNQLFSRWFSNMYDHDSQKSENWFWYVTEILKRSKNWSNNLLQNCWFFANYHVKTTMSS
jgi:hypothetical protein